MAGDLDFSDIATQSWVPAIDEVAMQVRTPARLQASNSCSSLETGLGANVGLLSRMLDELDYGLMLVTDDARVRLANREAKRECIRFLKQLDQSVAHNVSSVLQRFC